jgi:hypothetical protein
MRYRKSLKKEEDFTNKKEYMLHLLNHKCADKTYNIL